MLKRSQRKTELDPAQRGLETPHWPRGGVRLALRLSLLGPRASWGTGSPRTTEAVLVAGQIVLEVQAWGAPAISRLCVIEYLGGLA